MTDTGVSYRSTGWQQRAACSTAGLSPEDARKREALFAMRTASQFARYQHQPDKHPDVQKAKSFCDACPVRRECKEYRENTVDFPLVGVWGGEYISYKQALETVGKATGDGRRTRHTLGRWD